MKQTLKIQTLKRCPLCGAMPKLTAYREGVWVDVSCSNPVCNGKSFSFCSIEVAINRWNEYVHSTKLSQTAQEIYDELAVMKLKCCPFCGGIAEIEYEENDFAVKDNWVKVQCTECGGNSGWYLSEEEAITAWNKRSQS